MSLNPLIGAYDWWTPLVDAFSDPAILSALGWSVCGLLLLALVLSPIVYWLRLRPWRV